MTLTRRDRKALELAYECLRAADSVIARDIVWAYVALEAGDDMTIVKAIDEVRRGRPSADLLDAEPVLRARLALAIRLTLRIDAGDFGTHWECMECGDTAPMGDWATGCQWHGAGLICNADHVIEVGRNDALWQSAPLTGTAIRPAKLRRRGGA